MILGLVFFLAWMLWTWADNRFPQGVPFDDHGLFFPAAFAGFWLVNFSAFDRSPLGVILSVVFAGALFVLWFAVSVVVVLKWHIYLGGSL